MNLGGFTATLPLLVLRVPTPEFDREWSSWLFCFPDHVSSGDEVYSRRWSILESRALSLSGSFIFRLFSPAPALSGSFIFRVLPFTAPLFSSSSIFQLLYFPTPLFYFTFFSSASSLFLYSLSPRLHFRLSTNRLGRRLLKFFSFSDLHLPSLEVSNHCISLLSK